jgi:hypothetical protein
METHLRTDLVLAALDMAIVRRLPRDVIHHSDQGSQYTSIAYGQRCREFGVSPFLLTDSSMRRSPARDRQEPRGLARGLLRSSVAKLAARPDERQSVTGRLELTPDDASRILH